MGWNTVGDAVYAVGESPFWHPQERRLYGVDIVGRTVWRCDAQGGAREHWQLPSEPGCVAPAQGGGLVLALRDGVYRAPVWGGALQLITRLDYDPATVRANDGKCDALGRFWVGTLDETKTQGRAGLYCIDCRSGTPHIEQKVSGSLTANGLAWSPDGQTLYWTDTPRHRVYAWDYVPEDNLLLNDRVLVQFDPKPADWNFEDSSYRGRPDGAAVDVQGNYYCAMYEGAMVCKFSPQGELLSEIATPMQCPTMCCFGGDDLQTLFITSARHGRSEAELAAHPQSGAVLSRRMDVPGLPVHAFVGA